MIARITITGTNSAAAHTRELPLDKQGRQRSADALVQFLGIVPAGRASKARR